jgi:hypothetical protein
MNFGPHALYIDGTADRTFRQWRIRFSGNRPDFSNLAYFVRNGQRLPFLEALAKEGISKLIMSTDIDRTRGHIEDWLLENCLSEHAAQLIRSMVRLTTYCAEPKVIAADAAIRQMQLAFSKSALYLNGGWGTLVSGLMEKAASLGIQFETTASVKQIEGCSVKLADGRCVSGAGIHHCRFTRCHRSVDNQQIAGFYECSPRGVRFGPSPHSRRFSRVRVGSGFTLLFFRSLNLGLISASWSGSRPCCKVFEFARQRDQGRA